MDQQEQVMEQIDQQQEPVEQYEVEQVPLQEEVIEQDKVDQEVPQQEKETNDHPQFGEEQPDYKDSSDLFSIGFNPEVGRITFKGKFFSDVKQKTADWMFYKLVTYIVTGSVHRDRLIKNRNSTLSRLRNDLAISEQEISDADLFGLMCLLTKVHDEKSDTKTALTLDGSVTKFLNPGLIIVSGTSNTGKTAVLQKICSSLSEEATPLISIYEPQIDIAKITTAKYDANIANQKRSKHSFCVAGGLSLMQDKIAIDSITEILLTVPPGYATNKGGYSTPHIKSQLAILDCYCACTGATVIATLNTLGPTIEISVMDAINSVASLHVDLNAQRIHYRTLSDRHTVSVSSMTINKGESIWLNSDPGFVTTSIRRDGQTFFIESEGHYSDKELSVSELAKESNTTKEDAEYTTYSTSNFSSIVVK